LGHNKISHLPFLEEEMMIEHGSIGRNPLREPIGASWMFRKDARGCIPHLHSLLRTFPGIAHEIIEVQKQLFIHNCVSLNEPMVYEILYDGYEWKDGVGLVHPQHRYPHEIMALTELLTKIQPDVILHPSIAVRILHRF
jgi:hypothetical protein